MGRLRHGREEDKPPKNLHKFIPIRRPHWVIISIK